MSRRAEAGFSALKRKAGFSLPSAIFILVVLSAAGVFMTNLSGVQQHTANLSLGAARAWWAAHAGLEWGIDRTLAAGACQSGTFTLTEGGLAGFSVDVSCSASAHVEEATTTIYQLTATAERGSFGDRDHASRTLAATVTDVP